MSNKSPESFIRLHRNKLAAGSLAVAVVASFGSLAQHGGDTSASKFAKPAASELSTPFTDATVVDTRPASVTPSPSNIKLNAPRVSPSATPQTTESQATYPLAATAPSAQATVTHPETTASPVESSPAMSEIMTAMRNRKVGQKVPTLDLGEGKQLLLGGKIYTEPTQKAEQTNYLKNTPGTNAELLTLNSKQWGCIAVSNSYDIRCVLLDGSNTELSVFDEAKNTSTPLVIPKGGFVPKEFTIASVDEAGFGHDAKGAYLATNPPVN